MSLHEIRMGKEPIEAVTFSLLESKKRESDKLQKQVDEFLSKGRRISSIPIGITSEHHYIPNEFNGTNNAAAFDDAREVSARKCRKATMNSKLCPTTFESVYESDINREKFVVIIGKYISKQFDNLIQAVNHRDFRRKM